MEEEFFHAGLVLTFLGPVTGRIFGKMQPEATMTIFCITTIAI